MKKTVVIFASGDVDKLVRRLKIGTPDLELVAGDIVTQKIQDEMKTTGPNRFEHNLPLRREKLSNELMQGLNRKEIIVIDTKKSREFLPVYKKSTDMYGENLCVINLTVRNGNIEDHSKEVFLIKGDEYATLRAIITKVHVLPPLPNTATEDEIKKREELLKVPPIVFAGIETKSIEELEDTAITEVNRSDLSLLTIDTNIADDASRGFLTRLSERKGFAVISIESTEEITVEEETELSQHTAGDLEVKNDVSTPEKGDEEETLTIFHDAYWKKKWPDIIFPWTKNKEERRAAIEARKKTITGDPDKLAKLQEESKKLAIEKGIVKEERKSDPVT